MYIHILIHSLSWIDSSKVFGKANAVKSATAPSFAGETKGQSLQYFMYLALASQKGRSFRLQVEFRVWGLGFRVWGLGCKDCSW